MSIFVIAGGQDDNIGDVVLRRRMLAALNDRVPRHIFVHRASAGFREGLGLKPDDRIYDEYRTWLLACTWAALTSKVLIAHNAGEVVGNRDIARRELSLLPASLLARLRGGDVVRIGSGIRDATGRWMPVIRFLGRLDTTTLWRDEASRAFFGRGDVAPDWAFDDRLPHALSGQTVPRRYLAVSMRSDRPAPTAAWFDAVRSVAATRGLEIVVVSQVRRDNALGSELADRLGARQVRWEDASHLEQERTVREVYRQSALVVSDRLHALVIGLVEGAVPVGAIAWEDVKLARHFGAAGIDGVSFDTRSLDADRIVARIDGVADRREEILRAGRRAAEAVAAIDRRLAARVEGAVQPAV